MPRADLCALAMAIVPADWNTWQVQHNMIMDTFKFTWWQKRGTVHWSKDIATIHMVEEDDVDVSARGRFEEPSSDFTLLYGMSATCVAWVNYYRTTLLNQLDVLSHAPHDTELLARFMQDKICTWNMLPYSKRMAYINHRRRPSRFQRCVSKWSIHYQYSHIGRKWMVSLEDLMGDGTIPPVYVANVFEHEAQQFYDYDDDEDTSIPMLVDAVHQ